MSGRGHLAQSGSRGGSASSGGRGGSAGSNPRSVRGSYQSNNARGDGGGILAASARHGPSPNTSIQPSAIRPAKGRGIGAIPGTHETTYNLPIHQGPSHNSPTYSSHGTLPRTQVASQISVGNVTGNGALNRASNAPKSTQSVEAAENEFINKFSGSKALKGAKASIYSIPFPMRPSFGCKGTKITLWANCFELQVQPSLEIFQYSVDVRPYGHSNEAKGKKLGRLIRLALECKEVPSAASDFREYIYTKTQLQNRVTTLELSYRFEDEIVAPPSAQKYRVTISFANPLDVGDLLKYVSLTTPKRHTEQDVIQALNSIMGHFAHAAPSRFVYARNKVFVARNQANVALDMNSPLAASRGFFKSVRSASTRLLLNVNVSHIVLYQPVRLDALMDRFYSRGGSQNKVALEKFIAKLRVKVPELLSTSESNFKIKTISGLARSIEGGCGSHQYLENFGAGPAGVFLNKERITVAGKFEREHPEIKIEKKWPVVNLGNIQHPQYYPAEACTVLPDQPCTKKLTAGETQNMLNLCCRPPKSNKKLIAEESFNLLGIPNEIHDHFGIRVHPSLIQVPARMLREPSLKYGSNSLVIPQGGAWDTKGRKFAVARYLEPSWTYLEIKYSSAQSHNTNSGSYNTDSGPLATAIADMKRAFQAAGIKVSDSKQPQLQLFLERGRSEQVDARNMIKIVNFFDTYVGTLKLKMLFVILPDPGTFIYNAVKVLGDTKLGIHTVCMVQSKFLKSQGRGAYFANIALKVNLKLGGVNHVLPPEQLGIVGKGKTMMLGVDVTHPSPNSRLTAPSVTAVVANIDGQLGQWPGILSLQTASKQEITSTVLKGMVLSRLELWRQTNNALPENIICWRDGVAEGQYQAVIDKELPQIRNACREVYSKEVNAKGFPKLTMVVVGKRHQIRFYPTDDREIRKNAKGNCPNGTVMDRGVTNAQSWDFYLQAHQALQGTARPAHYYVLVDEIFRCLDQNPADALEELTHNLAYTFGRCTRAVSYCPAAYYADILCTRARCYLSQYFDPPDSVTSETGSQDGGGGPSKDMVKIAESLKDSMVYI